MQLTAILLLSIFLTVSAMSIGPGILLGTALGLLTNWCVNLQRRIAALEAAQPSPQARIDTARSALPAESAPDSEPYSAPTPQRTTPVPEPAQRETWGEKQAWQDPQEPESVPAQEFSGTRESLVQRLAERARSWLTTGNVPVKVGVVLSVFGLAFLVKEAVDRSWLVLPIELRLAGVALFGIAMLLVGWRLRAARAGYGLSLQGGGIAIVYLTVFAAIGIYSLIPAIPAFALLVGTTAVAGLLAVKQDARALAVLGIIGGFMAPVLASDGSGEHVILFSYYAILNCAIFGIAWRKAWRELNVLGFIFTFFIGSMWGYSGYSAAEFSTTEPFLILFFLMYVAVPILFARSAPANLRGFVDGTIVFGAPLVAFGLQSVLVADFEYGLAWSAVAVTTLYTGLAAALLLRGPEYMRVLGEAFAGLAIVFLAIAFPLWFDAQATSLAWAAQGAAMCWLGWRQSRPAPLYVGVILQGLSAAAFALANGYSSAAPAVLNGTCLGAVAIAIAAAVSSRVFDLAADQQRNRAARVFAGGLMIWSTLWWLGAGFSEIDRIVLWEYEISAYLAFAGVTIGLATLVRRIADWSRPAQLGVLLVPTLFLGAMWGTETMRPFANYGWLAWLIVFAAHLWYLRTCEQDQRPLARVLHPLGLITLAAILLLELHWHTVLIFSGVIPESLVLACAGLLLVALVRLGDQIAWPIGAEPAAYKLHAGGIIAAAGSAYMFVLNLTSDGAAGQLAYIPILNPLELASIGFAACLLIWLRALRGLGDAVTESVNTGLQYTRPAAALLSLSLLTMICARCVHHYAGVPFELERMLNSEVFQTALSILWGSLAFGSMMLGARRGNRFIWLSGGVLMSMVVVKLFLVDLANTATVERVVSFLGVGLLLLIVGYFAPVPPRNNAE